MPAPLRPNGFKLRIDRKKQLWEASVHGWFTVVVFAAAVVVVVYLFRR